MKYFINYHEVTLEELIQEQKEWTDYNLFNHSFLQLVEITDEAMYFETSTYQI